MGEPGEAVPACGGGGDRDMHISMSDGRAPGEAVPAFLGEDHVAVFGAYAETSEDERLCE